MPTTATTAGADAARTVNSEGCTAAETRAVAGCDTELRLIHDLLTQSATSGACRLLVGEPGIGRTTLLAEARRAAAARGMRVLHVAGSVDERLLPYSGVHQLLLPLLIGPDCNETERSTELRATIGSLNTTGRSSRLTAARKDAYTIATTVVEYVFAASRVRPILVVVDDLQWMDTASAELFAFLGRRVGAHPVGLLAAWRCQQPGDSPEWQLPKIAVSGLDAQASAALVDHTAPTLSRTQRARVLEQGRGNPLCLHEFAVAATSRPDEPSTPLPSPLWPTRALIEAYSPSLRRLPLLTRVALSVAALDDTLTAAEVIEVVARLYSTNPDPAMLQPARTRGLLDTVEGRVRVSHKAVQSLLFHSMDQRQRADIHIAIADVAHWGDRPVWHRAAASTGPDREVATALAEVGHRACDRGDLTSAAAAYRRSAMLTDDGQVRTSLLLEAAEAGRHLGRPDLISQPLSLLDQTTLGPAERLRVDLLGQTDGVGSMGRTMGVPDMVAVARSVDGPVPAEPRLELLLTAAIRCWRDGEHASGRAAVLTASEEVCGDSLNAHRLAILALTAPLTHGPRVLQLLQQVSADDRADPTQAALLGLAAQLCGDPAAARTLLATAAAGLRRTGRHAPLARTLSLHAHAAMELGNWSETLASAQECSTLAAATNQPAALAMGLALQGIVAAVHGESDRALELVERSERSIPPSVRSWAGALPQLARGILALSNSSFNEAWTHIRQTWDIGDEMSQRVALGGLGYLAEAARHRTDAANAPLAADALREMAAASSAPVALVGASFALAIASAEVSADALFVNALAHCGPDESFDRARIQLARGARLRRARRVAESRGPLREALYTFERLATPTWTEQARTELRATGERTVRRAVGHPEALSAQELQIVRLAAAGVTNREIAQRLCLSHRTIGSHLYRAFPKLGVSSRSQLRDLLPHLDAPQEPLAG